MLRGFQSFASIVGSTYRSVRFLSFGLFSFDSYLLTIFFVSNVGYELNCTTTELSYTEDRKLN